MCEKGQVLAEILDCYDAEVMKRMITPKDDVVFFLYVKPLVYGRIAIIKMKLEMKV